MRFDPRSLVVQLVSGAVLVLTLQQTLSALHASGAWQRPPRTERTPVDDPYSRLDALLASGIDRPTADGLHNPFVDGPARWGLVVTATPHPVVRRAPPPPPPQPTLTSIIWDNDPQATIRYDGHDYSVRTNALFLDFRVRSITATQVVLERNGQTLVLTLRQRGD